jgi:hypothetical protein
MPFERAVVELQHFRRADVSRPTVERITEAAGVPIGSGTVESAANTVVHHRMRRPGRGWTRANAQAMLTGVSELHSGRFADAWQMTLPNRQ